MILGLVVLELYMQTILKNEQAARESAISMLLGAYSSRLSWCLFLD